MRNNYYQQPYFQGNKSSTYINQMNPIISPNIKQNPQQNINAIKIQSTPQIIPTNKTIKRYLSPMRINRMDRSYYGNGINPKISNVKTFTSFNTPKLFESQNYNSRSLSKKMMRIHNLFPGPTQNPNIMNNIPINESTIKPINGAFANNSNQINNIITNQNIINLTNSNKKSSNLSTNPQINQSLTVNDINIPIINSNVIKSPIPHISNKNPIINQVPNSNLINNAHNANNINIQVPAPNAITAKNPAPNTNIINNPVPISNIINNMPQTPPGVVNSSFQNSPNIINNSLRKTPNVFNNIPQNPPNIINNIPQNPPNYINNPIPNLPNLINNSVQDPPNILTKNPINGLSNPINSQNYNVIQNKNLVNPINVTPTNFNPPMQGINHFGNGLNFNARNDISLVVPKPLGQQPMPINNNFLTMNNAREPNETINLAEFRILKEIGKGTFGKIYKALWIINNKVYALKKEILRDIEGVKVRQHRNEAIKSFIKQTNCKGVVSLFGNLTIPNGSEFQYYELMEMCDMDFEKEIKIRSVNFRFYSQQEMFNLMLQLITTLSFLQKCHITHRDIKPQNILISNGIYKLCDFGDIRVMQREGVVIQRVRGSELYMSPILFNGLRSKALQVRHNTYKSDVFSLGMCFLLAACLSYDGLVEIREISDMNQKDLILNKYLSRRYSPNMIKILHFMLQTEEINRPDFILLESFIRQFGI